jgi:membrane peptidoglycan carboxypeptidase
MRRGVGLLLLCALVAGCAGIDVRWADLTVEAQDTPTQTRMYAADGSLIATLRVHNRDLVTRDELPDVLLDAVVAAEDHRFYDHDGVDLRAIARAVVANRRAGQVVEGGSTITQQLVKNRYFPDADETLDRKIAEGRLALEFETVRSKDEILTDYLNTVYFGTGAYGIAAAARTYFDVEAGDLDLTQAALLAGLIRSPESASPHRDGARALAERDRVLHRMASTGRVNPFEAAAAREAPLGVVDPPAPPATRYPHFVEHVKRTLLADARFGADESERVRRLFGGGLTIHTTLDPDLQATAEQAAASLRVPGDPEVAVAVVRPRDGRLVAAVGGRDFAERQFDLATQGSRQPGSAFKTFALVAALRDGARLDEEWDAGPADIALPDGQQWQVRSATPGRLSLIDATARSSNGAFARLAMEVGPHRVAEQARAMGITSRVGTNPAIVLGGLAEGVSPLEMAGAYGTLATGGVHVPPHSVDRVTDAQGRTVWAPDTSPRVAMDAETAWLATQALRAVVEDGTGQAATIDRPAAGKTGTTQDHRDAWFVGFTPQLATAVWVGHPDEAVPLRDGAGGELGGSSWPARIWRQVMLGALAGEPVRQFPYPHARAVTVNVNPIDDTLAGQWCPVVVERSGLPAELPTQECTVHGPDDADPDPDSDHGPDTDDGPDTDPDQSGSDDRPVVGDGPDGRSEDRGAAATVD